MLTKGAIFHTDSNWNEPSGKRPGKDMAKELWESRV